jgi:hypothetical protein
MRVVSSGSEIVAINAAAESRHETLPAAAANNRGNILPQAEWFAVMARELWAFKVGAHLQHHLGYSDRTCRAWGSAESEPPARALALLLRTEDGPRVLAYIMRGSDAEWWAALQAAAAALGCIEK